MAGYQDYTDHGVRARLIVQLTGSAEDGTHSRAEVAKLAHRPSIYQSTDFQNVKI